MERLKIKGTMGGFEASRLGNASPRTLSVACSMGGADIDLSGAWVRDCDASISVAMGGMTLLIPDDIEVEWNGDGARDLAPASPAELEIPLPVLTLETHAKFGEIEVR